MTSNSPEVNADLQQEKIVDGSESDQVLIGKSRYPHAEILELEEIERDYRIVPKERTRMQGLLTTASNGENVSNVDDFTATPIGVEMHPKP